MFFLFLPIFLQVIPLTYAQESFRLSTQGCDNSIQDCSNPCSDESPPGLSLTCLDVFTLDLCSAIDPEYCQSSCGKCGKCFTSVLGCQCAQNWTLGQSEYSGCENPDQDELGSWCEIVPGSCAGIGSDGASYTPKKYDYCAADCKPITIEAPSDVSQDLAVPVDEPVSGPVVECYQGFSAPVPAKPKVVITVISRRIVAITNFDDEEIDMNEWIFLAPEQPQATISSTCQYRRIASQETKFIDYGFYTCQIDSIPSQYLRLVDSDERVINNVEVPDLGDDQVLCYQDGQHQVVSTLDCQWL
eukprot:TRINITY_DN38_c1_g1_i1.p1 TRINITY_DN38_c1_g1~~TRINITY_DN38_c1_g1_i1.p1  ORF type:complete len:336 (-),score=6.11 TRINITY_DN38_c1_g1_i1:195-1097(-)